MTLKALFRVRLIAFKGMMTGAGRSKRKRSPLQTLGFAALMLYAVGFFGFSFFTTFSSLAGPFAAAGLSWLYFAFAGLISVALMFVGSVFTAKSQLYEAKDNDLLLSMPILPRDILLSRLFLLLVLNLLMGLMTGAPAIAAWFLTNGFSLPLLLRALLVFFVLLPLLVLMLTALFGWLLHLASARVRNQSMLTVVLSLCFLALYFFIYSQMNTWLFAIASDPSGLARSLGGAAPLVWLGRGVAEGDAASLLKLALGVAAVFAAGFALLSKSFIRTATDRRGAAKIQYVEKKTDALTPRRALLLRELRHLWKSPGYLLNSGFGAILAPAAAVALLIKRDALLVLMENPDLAPLLPVGLVLGLCFIAASTCLTAPSVSLEGKSLWLLQSLPVTPQEALGAKLRLHLLISLPAIGLTSLVFALVAKPAPLLFALMLLVPAAFAAFSGLIGLFENLRHPNFDWTNETQAVKSSGSVLFSMLLCWGLLIPPAIVLAAFGSGLAPEILLGAYLALLCVLDLLLYRRLMRRGAEIFRGL